MAGTSFNNRVNPRLAKFNELLEAFEDAVREHEHSFEFGGIDEQGQTEQKANAARQELRTFVNQIK